MEVPWTVIFKNNRGDVDSVDMVANINRSDAWREAEQAVFGVEPGLGEVIAMIRGKHGDGVITAPAGETDGTD